MKANPFESTPNEEQGERGVKTYETLCDTFESTHDLELLHGLKTQAEALASEERQAAKLDLRPIVRLYHLLDKDPAVTREQLDILLERYRVLSRAVGMINSGLVDHTR